MKYNNHCLRENKNDHTSKIDFWFKGNKNKLIIYCIDTIGDSLKQT